MEFHMADWMYCRNVIVEDEYLELAVAKIG